MPPRAASLALPILLACIVLAGCDAAGAPRTVDGRLNVVAAESMWGNVAAQLGGARVRVTNLVSNPSADPHDYEPTPADARAFASAQIVVVNGAGYDRWASNLLAASASAGRRVLDVSRLVGVPAGGNPHRWYSPADVRRVVAAVSAAYRSVDPAHAGYYRTRNERFLSTGLARYRRLIAAIRERFAGTPVGASESVFAPLAASLGLRLVTPPSLLDAVSEGAEPSLSARSQAASQIAGRRIGLWVYNSQNSTPDVSRLTAAARAHGIPVVTITETLPRGESFQEWQSRQLAAIEGALAGGDGR